MAWHSKHFYSTVIVLVEEILVFVSCVATNMLGKLYMEVLQQEKSDLVGL